MASSAVRSSQYIGKHLPLWNFNNLIYRHQKENYRKCVHGNLLSTYGKPKWQWAVAPTYQASQALTKFVASIGQSSGPLPSQSPTISSNATTRERLQPQSTSIWSKLSSITSSKSYKTFLKVNIAKSDLSNDLNSGVTVATTKPAILMTGDEKLRRLRLVLDSFPNPRGEIQIMFHERFIQACLPIIYRGEWEYNFDAIMRRNRVMHVFQEMAMICPRRYGKSWSVAYFGASTLWTLPGITLTFFSRGKRMAQKLMLQCLRFALTLPGFDKYKSVCTTEKVELNFGNGDIRSLCCLPGSVEV